MQFIAGHMGVLLSIALQCTMNPTVTLYVYALDMMIVSRQATPRDAVAKPEPHSVTLLGVIQ